MAKLRRDSTPNDWAFIQETGPPSRGVPTMLTTSGTGLNAVPATLGQRESDSSVGFGYCLLATWTLFKDAENRRRNSRLSDVTRPIAGVAPNRRHQRSRTTFPPVRRSGTAASEKLRTPDHTPTCPRRVLRNRLGGSPLHALAEPAAGQHRPDDRERTSGPDGVPDSYHAPVQHWNGRPTFGFGGRRTRSDAETPN